MIPVLETERLVLRGHGVDDLDDVTAVWGDPEVVRFIGGKIQTREECWSRLLRYVGHWSLKGFGFWAIRERATGLYVGETGFANFEREMSPPLGDAPEMGWVLGTRAHGKGFATEAVTAAIDWAGRHLPGRTLVCIVDPGNAASLRVAGKVGFREVRRADYKGSQTVVFER